MPQDAIYSMESTREVAGFLDGVINTIKSGGGGEAVLDSVKNEAGVTAPGFLNTMLGEAPEDSYKKIFDSVTKGVSLYHREHGCYPTADVAEAALQQGLVAFRGIDQRGHVLDSASSVHHDQMSLQPNRAVVAILSLFSEAIPWASYLPVDIGSNEGRLAILSHIAGSTGGDYVNGGLLDGTNSGGVFSSSQRMVKFNVATGTTYNSAFTTTNLGSTPGYCDPAGTGVPVLRGRTTVYINGLVAAVDASNGSGTTSSIAGTITMPSGVQISLTGTVTLATGAIAITSSIALAAYDVTAQSIIDFELQPALIQKINVNAAVYQIFANPWRVMTGVTIDANTQIRSELGLDAASEGLLAIRAQMAQERHYQALRMAYAIGKNNQVPYNFQYAVQIQQKTRAQIWQDFASVIGNADQTMANQTMDHGITHLYVPAFISAQMASLPPDLFVPSGIETRATIYRVGRLFNKYDVYYDPKIANQSADLTTAEMVAVGRSTQVARNPVVLGDAVSPTMMQLGLASDLVQNAAVYGRDFTVVNPHQLSALGAARISVSNLA